MQKAICVSLFIILSGSLAAQTKNDHRNVPKTVFEGRPATVRLAPHVTTTIWLPEPVNSVVVGEPNLFQAEHSPSEPLLVFARPIAQGIAESNLVISTVFGRHFILVLRSLGASPDGSESGVDLLVTCQVAGVRFIEETFPSVLISETVDLGSALPPVQPGANGLAPKSDDGVALDEMLDRQRKQKIEKLYGDRIRVGIGRVAEDGARLIVSFSVTNPTPEPIELVPPQVQLAGRSKGSIFKRSRWTTVQQLPVHVYRLTDRRVNPRRRVDGVVVFERPPIKQSTEELLLQIADSGAVDQPALAPINFRETQTLEKDHE